MNFIENIRLWLLRRLHIEPAKPKQLAFVMMGAGVLGLAITMFMSRRKKGN